MSVYRQAYASVLKKNFMLLVIALVLVFFTFAFWIGIPIFLVGDILVELHIPYFIMIMSFFYLLVYYFPFCSFHSI